MAIFRDYLGNVTMSPIQILLKLRMQVAVTNWAIKLKYAKPQSNRHHQQTNSRSL